MFFNNLIVCIFYSRYGVILHIATIKNNPFNGVCVVAPKHVKFQGEYAKVALLNMDKYLLAHQKGLLPIDIPYCLKMPLYIAYISCHR